ncbi:MAG: hypothetical protein M3P44_10545, partial [Actinomycetota bacterium]|nr:hypothetical protein [Actinomycetota bacterium]
LISTRRSPATDEVTDARTRALVKLLAAAPASVRAQTERAFVGDRGLTVRLADGPALYFGAGNRLAAKWTAVVRVLQDRSSAGATYLDVRLPERAAAGGLAPLHPATATPGTAGTVGAQPAQPTTTAPAPVQPATPIPTAP